MFLNFSLNFLSSFNFIFDVKRSRLKIKKKSIKKMSDFDSDDLRIANTSIYSFGEDLNEQADVLIDQFPNTDSEKILALDLDETLVHASFVDDEPYDFETEMTLGNQNFKVYIQKRPGLDYFLQKVLEAFDVYIFTASVYEYCWSVISNLIPGFPTEKILTRDHCKYLNGNFIKELSLFGKDLSKVVIVDDKAVSFCLNPSNGITIPTWLGDESDDKLISETLPLLEKCYYADDVRTVISQNKAAKRRRRTREW